MATVRRALLILILAAQFCLTTAHLTIGTPSLFPLALASATLLAVSILINDLSALFPVYAHMHKSRTAHHLHLRVKMVYAALAFVAALLGAALIPFYRWMFVSILEMTHLITNMNHENPVLPALKWAGEVLLSPANRNLLICVICTASAFLLLETITRRYGPRATVRRIYEKHHLKYVLARQEREIEIIALGAGLAISFYFSVLFLGLAAARGFRRLSFDEWVREQATAPTFGRDEFATRSLSIYKGFVVLSLMWLPFFDPHIYAQWHFVVVMHAPLCLSLLMNVMLGRIERRTTAALFVLKLGFSVSMVYCGLLQYFDYQANPLIAKIVVAFSAIEPPMIRHFMLVSSKVLFVTLFVNSATETWVSKVEGYRAKGDPVGAFVQRKVLWFRFSLLLRAASLFLFFTMTRYFDAAEWVLAEMLAAGVLSIGMASITLVDGEHGERVACELSQLYSRASLDRSRQRWQDRLTTFKRVREVTNMGYLLFCIALGAMLGRSLLLCFCIIAGLLGLLFYYLSLVVEVMVGKKYLGLADDLIPCNRRLANVVTFGQFDKYMGYRGKVRGG